jgi:hypothetical protein
MWCFLFAGCLFLESTRFLIDHIDFILLTVGLQDMIPAKPTQTYVPRVYGFKVHESSLYYRNHEEGPQKNQIESARNRKSRQRNRR